VTYDSDTFDPGDIVTLYGNMPLRLVISNSVSERSFTSDGLTMTSSKQDVTSLNALSDGSTSIDTRGSRGLYRAI